MKFSIKKTIVLLFPLVFAISLCLCAQTKPQHVFRKANEQYKQGHIHKALTHYHQLEQQNLISGALFMNMGLSYIRLDSLGKAEYYFLQASRFGETKKPAEQGINYVQKNLSHRSAVLPTLPWRRAFGWMRNHIGVIALLAIGLVLINISVALYILQWFLKRFNRIFVNVAIITTVIGVLAIFSSFYISYRTHRYHEAVMIAKKTNVNQKPAAKSTIVNKAYEGYVFTVDKRKSDKETGWSYIRMSNGQYGWIRSNKIMVL
jgi:tetratricopeptide (TPR) repeat protein